MGHGYRGLIDEIERTIGQYMRSSESEIGVPGIYSMARATCHAPSSDYTQAATKLRLTVEVHVPQMCSVSNVVVRTLPSAVDGEDHHGLFVNEEQRIVSGGYSWTRNT